MLPGNIDLTAHHDFGSDDFINFINTDTLVGIDVDGEMMSVDQYDKLVEWENVFGKERHSNQKNYIFNKDWPLMEKVKHECQRCGRPLLAPWKNFYGLCEECNTIVHNDVQRIPWKIYRPTIRRINDRGQGDLFDLR